MHGPSTSLGWCLGVISVCGWFPRRVRWLVCSVVNVWKMAHIKVMKLRSKSSNSKL